MLSTVWVNPWAGWVAQLQMGSCRGLSSGRRTRSPGYVNTIERASRQTSVAARISLQRCTGWEITLLFQGNGISPSSSSPSGPAHGVQRGWCRMVIKDG